MDVLLRGHNMDEIKRLCARPDDPRDGAPAAGCAPGDSGFARFGQQFDMGPQQIARK